MKSPFNSMPSLQRVCDIQYCRFVAHWISTFWMCGWHPVRFWMTFAVTFYSLSLSLSWRRGWRRWFVQCNLRVSTIFIVDFVGSLFIGLYVIDSCKLRWSLACLHCIDTTPATECRIQWRKKKKQYKIIWWPHVLLSGSCSNTMYTTDVLASMELSILFDVFMVIERISYSGKCRTNACAKTRKFVFNKMCAERI